MNSHTQCLSYADLLPIATAAARSLAQALAEASANCSARWHIGTTSASIGSTAHYPYPGYHPTRVRSAAPSPLDTLRGLLIGIHDLALR